MPRPNEQAADPYRKVYSLEEHRQQLGDRAAEPLKQTGGGGTSDGMDAWQQTVETRLGALNTGVDNLSERLNARVLWILSAFAAGFVLLAGLIVNRTDAVSTAARNDLSVAEHRLDERFDKLNDKLDAMVVAKPRK